MSALVPCGMRRAHMTVARIPVILECIRPAGHEGEHHALYPASWLTWVDNFAGEMPRDEEGMPR